MELPKGIPDEKTFARVFAFINPQELIASLEQWLDEAGKSGGREINIVSAWVGAHNLVRGQLATEEKSNEITAIPVILN